MVARERYPWKAITVPRGRSTGRYRAASSSPSKEVSFTFSRVWARM